MKGSITKREREKRVGVKFGFKELCGKEGSPKAKKTHKSRCGRVAKWEREGVKGVREAGGWGDQSRVLGSTGYGVLHSKAPLIIRCS